MQQLPNQQMMIQNPQNHMQMPQQLPQNQQLFEVVQTNSSLSLCEKFSKKLTNSSNIPLTVFLILMGSSLFFIITLIIGNSLITGCLCLSSFANFLFALFVWAPMAIKIENNTSTVRYGLLYIINSSIITVCSFGFPLFNLHTIWTFVLFETLLIAFSNKDKKMKFFGFKIGGKTLIILSIIYHLIFDGVFIFSLIVTIAYTFIYKKKLINKFSISNEKVEKIENWCFINWLKNKISTFITLKEVLEKENQNPSQSNIQNSNNSSFIPMNMYPNYYSGLQQPMQPMGQAEEIKNVESNENLQ